MSDPSLGFLNALFGSAGRTMTREQINAMNPLDLIGTIAPELQNKILEPALDDKLRARFARIALKDQFQDESADHFALPRAPQQTLDFTVMAQENFDENHSQDEQAEDRNLFYTERPTIRYFDGRSNLVKDGGFKFDAADIEEKNSVFKHKNSVLHTHNILDPVRDAEFINTLLRGSAEQIQERREIANTIRNLEQSLSQKMGGLPVTDYEGEDFQRLVEERLDYYHGMPESTGFSDVNGVWAEPLNPNSRYIGRRDDFQEEVQDLSRQLDDTFDAFLGDSPADYDGLDDYLRDATDLENYIDDPDLFPLDDDNVYSEAAANGMLDLEDFDSLREHLEEVQFLRNKRQELFNIAAFSDTGIIINQDSIDNRHDRQMAAARSHLGALTDMEEFINSYDDYELDGETMDSALALGNFTDDEKRRLRSYYQEVEETEDEDEDEDDDE